MKRTIICILYCFFSLLPFPNHNQTELRHYIFHQSYNNNCQSVYCLLYKRNCYHTPHHITHKDLGCTFTKKTPLRCGNFFFRPIPLLSSSNYPHQRHSLQQRQMFPLNLLKWQYTRIQIYVYIIFLSVYPTSISLTFKDKRWYTMFCSHDIHIIYGKLKYSNDVIACPFYT